MSEIKTHEKNVGKTGIAVFIACMVFISCVIVSVHASGTTSISVNPLSTIVSPEDSFVLDIYCVPDEPIKSFELKVSFDENLLQATGVTEGTIFSGYSTFFNEGIINNEQGNIINVYGLILGPETVTEPGTLISISFTAKTLTGVSAITLYDVGVTNEVEYLPISVVNGSVSIQTYTLTVDTDGEGSVHVDPDQETYSVGDSVELTAETDEGWTFSHWSGNLSGSSNPVMLTMDDDKTVTAHFTQNLYLLTIHIIGEGSVAKNPDKASYGLGEIVQLTAHEAWGWSFDSWSGDLSGSENPTTITMDGHKEVTAHFIDSAGPEIYSIDITTSDPLDTDPLFGYVNISCTVTDNVEVSLVQLRIQYPLGSWNNVSMNSLGSGLYYYHSSTAFSSVGNYSYFIWASDINDNTNTSDEFLFSMPPNWDINMDGQCTVVDLMLISNYYNAVGEPGWIREDVDNNGIINVLDLVFVANHYAETWW